MLCIFIYRYKRYIIRYINIYAHIYVFICNLQYISYKNNELNGKLENMREYIHIRFPIRLS